METITAVAGARVGPYELGRPLGSGGMGEVWEAILHGPDGYRKPVALKLLREGPTDPHARQALVNEARLGALLHHPNVVAAGALGEVDGRWHLAMELVRGASVAELCARGPLPPRVVLEIGIQACAGLGHIHALKVDGRPMGLVHRDVKGQNLLVDQSGTVKVADLGVAGFGEAGESGVATAGYTAPEQLDRRPEARSDLFSLGVVLYVTATGRRPFGRGADALEAVRGVEALLAEPSFLAPVEDAVAGLAPVVRRCLRADPRERWESALELREALIALRPRQRVGPTLLDLLARARPELGVEDPSLPTAGLTVVVSRGNLQPPRDRFLGRTSEVDRVVSRISAREPLIALLGPGGTGKTRLAKEAVTRLPAEPAGGSWFFDLSEARSVDAVCFAVGTGLGLALERNDPIGQVGHALRARGPAVVILDNLEQCVEHLPATLGRWMVLAPEAVVVCTSRVALRLTGEHAMTVGPLTPDDGTALFIERSPVPIPSSDRDAVRSLVTALEGVPLAIELAAARTRLLPVAEIRRRLTVDSRVLGGGGGDRPERHRSVEGSLRWSWELLSPFGRRALCQLSLFEGGFDLPAAEAVLDGERWALEVLQELVEASLVRVDPDDSRFSMLVVVQQFANRQLSAEERRAAETRHGAYYAQYGSREALEQIVGLSGTDRLWVLVAEIGNLTAASQRAVARGDGEVAVATALAGSEVYAVRGPFTAGVALLEAAEPMPGLPPRVRTLVWERLGHGLASAGRGADAVSRIEAALAWYRAEGDHAGARRMVRRLAALYRSVGRRDESRAMYETAVADERDPGSGTDDAMARADLGVLHMEAGRMAEARVDLEASAAAHRDSGNRRLEGLVNGNLAVLNINQGRLEEARACLHVALTSHQGVGDRRGEGIVLMNLGVVDQMQGRVAPARRMVEAALAVLRELGSRRDEGMLLGNLGVLNLDEGRSEDALRCYESAIAIHRELGNRQSEGVALANLGYVHYLVGRPAQARAHYEASLMIHREMSARRNEGIALESLGMLEFEAGREAEAVECLESALAIHREVGNRRSEGMTLGYLGAVALDQGRVDEARLRFEAALAIHREIGDDTTVAVDVGYLGRLALREGRWDEARTLLEAAVSGLEGREVRDWVTCLGELGEARAASDPIGARRALDQAVAEARAGGWPVVLAEALGRQARVFTDLVALNEAEALADRLGFPEASPLERELRRARALLGSPGEGAT